MNFYAITDTGRVRQSNQDFVFASDSRVGTLTNLYIVADGMGGHNAGEVASEYAIKTALSAVRASTVRDPEEVLVSAVSKANRAVFLRQRSETSMQGMGTTFVAATIDDGVLHVVNVGDSRLYIISGGRITQLTRDHSVVEEMVRRGFLTEEDASHHRLKHKITRAVGVEEQVEVDTFRQELAGDEILLMCTDGLTNMVPDPTISKVLSSGGSLKERTDKLLHLANENGGVDNITILTIEPFAEEVEE